MSADLSTLRARPAALRSRAAGLLVPALAIASLLAGGLLVGNPVQAQDAATPDTFTATTGNMTPEGLGIEIDVIAWSSASEREAVVAALTPAPENPEAEEAESGGPGRGGFGRGSGGGEDSAGPAERLAELPTKGYLWTDGSSVGYALKYAHRQSEPGGGERITLVTDKALGQYGREAWQAAGAPAPETEYSVIELVLDENGEGAGTLSLAAEVELDADAGIVGLAGSDTAPRLLVDAALEPKPYWAAESSGQDAGQ